MGFILHKQSVNRGSVAERMARRRADGLRDIGLAVHEDEPPARERVPLLNAKPNRCRWPYGHPTMAHVCHQKAVIGTSWCPYHLRRVFPKDAERLLADRRTYTDDEASD